ncbi:type II secretion system protein [Campylobacter magnus]|uniref:Type II secretion system protein n=1 Tax=Campylobacter magnus TaxID=3026462 RepID=A0ABT8T6T5_9BACT|nr:type II secretion system protein [Campylobacter magnus]MDO2409233.1 type II secretion system protein [Campylobacter magnus]
MKKGFTMIELIFVIVILGILASVAIPRLAATRTDAEIATTVSNIRTLISDAASYYAVKGSFEGAKWRDFTNVPIRLGNKNLVQANTPITGDYDGAYYLSAGGVNCIVIRIRANTTPACIEIGKVRAHKNDGICPEVLEAEPIKAFLESKVPGVTPIEENDSGQKEAGIIALGSSISIYPEATTTPAPTPTPAP